MKGVITARFPGWCLECVERIEVGQEILPATIEGTKGWVHVECPDTPDERPTKFTGTTDEEMGFV